MEIHPAVLELNYEDRKTEDRQADMASIHAFMTFITYKEGIIGGMERMSRDTCSA
jgi:hypothetical protein